MCGVPTILREGPFQFYFYSADDREPPHVHVDRDQGRAKIWLDPVTLAWAAGFTRHDIRRILKIVQRNRDELERSWNEYFKR